MKQFIQTSGSSDIFSMRYLQPNMQTLAEKLIPRVKCSEKLMGLLGSFAINFDEVSRRVSFPASLDIEGDLKL